MKKVLILIILLNAVLTNQMIAQGFAWAKHTGTIGDTEEPYSIAVDAVGNTYAVGIFDGTTDFDPSIGVYNLTAAGAFDIYVWKLDVNGNLVYAHRFGAAGLDVARDIAVDDNGNVYITGTLAGNSVVDFDPGVGVFNLTNSNGSYDAFILKLDANGNFGWVKRIGGTTPAAEGHTIVVKSNSVYVAGTFTVTIDLDFSAGVTNVTSFGGTDIFVLKLTTTGNFVFGKQLGGANNEEIYGMDLDNNGNILTTGLFQNSADFDPSAATFNITSTGGTQDIFISKLDSLGAFVWAKTIGIPTTNNDIRDIKTDNNNNVHVIGYFSNQMDFDPGAGVYNLTPNGRHTFVLRLNDMGNFVWVKTFNHSGSGTGAEPKCMTIDNGGNIYIAGYYAGTVDFDPGVGVYNLLGNPYLFICKLDFNGDFLWVASIDGTGLVNVRGIGVDNIGNVYTTGYKGIGSFDFDPSAAGVYNLVTTGTGTDIFINKLYNCTTPNAPTNTTASANLTICANNSTTLTGSGNAIGSLSWYDAPTGGNYVGTGSTFNTPILNSTTTYYLQDSVCTSSSTRTPITVTVNQPSIAPTSIAGTAVICQNDTATLTLIGGSLGTGATAEWSAMTCGTTIISVNNTLLVSPSNTTTYFARYSGVCNTTSCVSVVVTVNSLPTVSSNIAPAATVCEGTTITLSGTGANTYTWSDGVTDNTGFIPSASGTYTVTGTDVNGCSATATQNVVVNPLPIVTFDLDIDTVCSNVSTTPLTTVSPVGGVYTGLGVNGNVFDATTLAVGSYTITYTYTDANNCANIATEEMFVDICTGLEKLSPLTAISIYPNPTNDLLTIQLNETNTTNLNLKLVNVAGITVLDIPISTQQMTVDVSDLSAGVYFLVASNAAGVGTYKIVKY